MKFKLILTITTLLMLFTVKPVYADVYNYSDVKISNLQFVDNDLKFTLSEEIPNEEVMFITYTVETTPINNIETKIDRAEIKLNGGKDIKLENFYDVIKELSFDEYKIIMQICPDNSDLKGIGKFSGCSLSKSMITEFRPWKLSFENEKTELELTQEDSFTITATKNTESPSQPNLNLLTMHDNNKRDEAIDCIQTTKTNNTIQWDCAINSTEKLSSFIGLSIENKKQVSNNLYIKANSSDSTESIQFNQNCEIRLVNQFGAFYQYFVVDKLSGLHTPTCKNAKYEIKNPAILFGPKVSLIEQDEHGFIVFAPSTDRFNVYAHKANGEWIKKTENIEFPDLNNRCQLRYLQQNNILTILKTDNNGVRKSECFFANPELNKSSTSLGQLQTNADLETLYISHDRIIIDAKKENTIYLKTTRSASNSNSNSKLGSFENEGSGVYNNDYQREKINTIKIYPILNRGEGTIFEQTFSDIDQNHPNRTATQFLREMRMIDGYEDETFKPDNLINRAEFIKITSLALTSDREVKDCDSTGFKDFQKNKWYNRYICLAKDQNLVEGYPDNTFRPEANINFAEASKILTKMFNITAKQSEVWYLPYTDALAERNIIPETIQKTDQLITRGEMAEMLYRMLSGNSQKTTKDYKQLLLNSGIKN